MRTVGLAGILDWIQGSIVHPYNINVHWEHCRVSAKGVDSTLLPPTDTIAQNIHGFQTLEAIERVEKSRICLPHSVCHTIIYVFLFCGRFAFSWKNNVSEGVKGIAASSFCAWVFVLVPFLFSWD